MKICICGGGNLGHVVAGFVAAQNQYEVCVLTRQPERWSQDILIDTPEQTTYSGRLSGIFSDAKQAISDADIVLLCLPGYGIRDTLIQIIQTFYHQKSISFTFILFKNLTNSIPFNI